MEKRLVNHSTKSQCAAILRYLMKGKTLTHAKAEVLFQCARITSRVHDLKKDGYPIKSRLIKTLTGKRVAEYWLEVKCSRQ